MIRDYARLALRSLAKRRLRSWLTMIGIVLGIAVVVGLISLGQGMQRAVEEQFFQLGVDKIQVIAKGASTGPPGSNTDVKLTESDRQVVERASGVEVAGGRLIEPIRVSFNDRELFRYVATLPDEQEQRRLIEQISDVEPGSFVAGRQLEPGDRWKAVVSEDYRDNPRFDGKALRVGDKIRINGQDAEVVGIFAKTGNPLVDMTFVMNERPVRDLLGIPEKYGIIGVQVEDPGDIRRVAENIEKDLRSHRDVDEDNQDFDVNTAEDLLETFQSVLAIVTGVLVGIAAISLLVGGIGIMNTMFTAVLQRHKEIGIMKAIGARNSDILTIFLFEAGLLGAAGGIIGILIGMALSKLVEVGATLALGTTLIKASFPWYLILGALVFSFAVGAFAGTFPALQAARLQPVEALRK